MKNSEYFQSRCVSLHFLFPYHIELNDNLLQIPMAIMQYFSQRFKEKKSVDSKYGQEALTDDCTFKPELLNIPNSRNSHQRKWSETLSHVYHEDNIFSDQFR